jgi:tRNA G10  N-methylase Trm11
MSIFYCHLGNTPELSLFELENVLKQTPVSVLPTVAKVELPNTEAAKELMTILGGTVKIYQHLESFPEPDEDNITQSAINHLVGITSAKVTFGISHVGEAGETPIKLDIVAVKHALKDRNIPSRYVDSDSQYGVAVPILLKKLTHELVVITTPEEAILAETVAVQDINDWTKRDRHKPYADRKKGMLPPKVARMMVNIGLGLLPGDKDKSDITLSDPFCGSGTVLMEASMLGVKVEGSDLDKEAAQGTRDNLAWLSTAYDKKITFSVAQRDATQRVMSVTKPWVDTIVTEPFLGKPTPKDKELGNIFKGLYRLYLGAFKNWVYQLNDGASVAIVFPIVETDMHRYSLEPLIDKLKDLGYTSVSRPIVYRRPQAIVQRQINFFRFDRR